MSSKLVGGDPLDGTFGNSHEQPAAAETAPPIDPGTSLEQQLRRKHKWVQRVEVPGEEPDGEPIVLYFKRPSRAAVGAMARYAQSNVTKAAEIVFQDALVHGPKEALEDDEIFFSLLPLARQLTEGRAIEVKKL